MKLFIYLIKNFFRISKKKKKKNYQPLINLSVKYFGDDGGTDDIKGCICVVMKNT